MKAQFWFLQLMRTFLAAGLSLVVLMGGTPSANAQDMQSLFSRGTTTAVFDEARAEEIWREMIRQAPNNTVGHYYLGLSLTNQGEFASAEAAYREVIRLNGKNAIAHYNLALVLLAQGKQAEGEAAVLTAVNLYEQDAAAYCDLANTLEDQYRFEAAMEATSNAIVVDADYAFADGPGMGAVCTMHRFTQTAGLLTEATMLYPNQPEWQYRLGAVLDRQHRWEAAIAAYESAIRLDPTYSDAYRRLSSSLTQVGNDAAAEEAYQTALWLEQNSVAN